MCSLVLTGWNPTNGTCILARVPIAYQEEYATYKRSEKRPMKIRTKACRGIMFVMNTYPPRKEDEIRELAQVP
jgi:hypothetical protein